jgi:hypothetical protein
MEILLIWLFSNPRYARQDFWSQIFAQLIKRLWVSTPAPDTDSNNIEGKNNQTAEWAHQHFY